MKKHDLLKVLGITFAIVVILSWIIHSGAFSGSEFVSSTKTNPIGLYDITLLPIVSIVSFIQYGLLFLAIGGFYGVLNGTGAYKSLLDKIVNKVKNKPKRFLVITISVLSLLSSLTNLTTALFILVPFLVAIIMLLGYDKLTAFATTIGSIIVGQIGSTFGFTISGQLRYYLSLSMTYDLFIRIVLLVITTFLLIMVVLKKGKQITKKSEIKKTIIPLCENNDKKKSKTPLIIIGIITFIFALIGMYNWYYGLEVEIFNKLHTTITSFDIKGYPLLSNILGSTSGIGYFTNYDLVILLVLASLLLGWIYSIKFDDIIDNFANGAKQMLKPAFYVSIASVIYSFVYFNATDNFVNTIIGTFGKDNAITIPLKSIIMSVFYNDFANLIGYNYALIASSASVNIFAVILPAIYGLVMLIAPTSIFLIGGLAYLDIPYTKWVKYIWKFILIILVAVLAIGLIMIKFL